MSATIDKTVITDRMEEVGDKIIAFVKELGLDPQLVLSIELESKGAFVTEIVDGDRSKHRTTHLVSPVSLAWKRDQGLAA